MQLRTFLFSLLVPIFLTSNCLAQDARNGAATNSAPSITHPQPPGIFAVGFTNVTDTSARLVFTTSEPMTTTVVVYNQDKEDTRLNQPAADEIHSVDILNLTKGTPYHLTIIGVTGDGQTVTSENHLLTPMLRPASSHEWPGYTIFSTSINGPTTPEVLDLAAQTGVRMLRMDLSWDGLFPNKGQINQPALDAFVKRIADMKAHNIEPLVILDYCAIWAKHYTNTTMTWRHPAFGPPDDLADWDEYVRTIATALHGSVKYYEIWNEPDAGYLATGRYIERPDMPAPIGRAPYKDNIPYWMGDRYAPMIEQVRKVMDDVQPDAILLNGGWNRDYSGQRGDILFQHGIAPYFDVYAFHCYSAMPVSFSRWFGAIDGQFRKNIDRNFTRHDVHMPLAITEWGWPAWSDPQTGKGFVGFEDQQKFFVKSTFYFLGLQRFEILSQFSLGVESGAPDIDPHMFELVQAGTDGKLAPRPAYKTFQWLATTFGSHPYRSLPVQANPSDQVKAIALQMKDSGDTYLAVWQDGVPDDKGAIPAQPARDVTVSIDEFKDGNYAVQPLDVNGAATGSAATVASPFQLKVTLPEISSTAESGIYLAKITKLP